MKRDKKLDLHDSTLLALWIVVWAYPNTSAHMQRQNRNFYEAAKRDLKRIYGIKMEDIKKEMEKEYHLNSHPTKWAPHIWAEDWKKDLV